MTKIPIQMGWPQAGTQPVQHGGPEEDFFKETAAQTYSVNDLIYLDTNGTIAIVTSSALNSVFQVTSAILGTAEAAASGTTGAKVKFNAIDPAQTYIMNAFHPTQASAKFAQTDLGARFNIGASSATSAGIWMVDKRNAVVTTLPMVRVVGFPKSGLDSNGNFVTNAAVGDIFGLAYVQFVPHYETISGGNVTGVLDALQLW